MDIMRQYACLVVNQIIVYSYIVLYTCNCTTVGLASDSMKALKYSFYPLVGVLCLFWLGPPWPIDDLALTTYVNREICSLFHLSNNVIRFVLSIFEWPFFTCFTVLTFQSRYITLYVI